MPDNESMRSHNTGHSSIETRDQKKISFKIREALFKPPARGWKQRWDLIYKEAIFQTMVALVKESEAVTVPLIVRLIEFVQLYAFLFAGINWGEAGNSFGKAIKYTQFEFIFYTIAGMDTNSADGWINPLSSTQMITFWCIFGFSLLLTFMMIATFAYVFQSFVTKSFSVGVTPLRILRFLVSILCGVLYIPLLSVLVSSLRIGYKSSTLMLVLGIIGLIFAIPFCFLMGFTYFNPNPMSKDMMARMSPNLELFDMILRSGVIFLDVFTPNHAVYKVLTIAIIKVYIAVYLLRFFPYYSRKINILRMCMAIMMSFSGWIATGAALATDATIIFWFLMASWIPMLTIIIWRGNKLYLNAVFGAYHYLLEKGNYDIVNGHKTWAVSELAFMKFSSPFQVEIATRYLKQLDLNSKEGLDALAAADTIIERGLEQFPDNGFMLCFAGIFHGVYKNNFALWKNYLDIADKSTMDLAVEMLIAQSRSLREGNMRKVKLGQDALDLLDVIEIQNLMKLVKRKIAKYKEACVDLWKILLLNKVEPDKVQRLVNKMYMNQKSSKSILDYLSLKYVNQVETLSQYAKFMEDIEREYEEADELWELVGELLDKNALNLRKHAKIVNTAQDKQDESQEDGHGEVSDGELSSPHLSDNEGRNDKSVVSFRSEAESRLSSNMSAAVRHPRNLSRKEIKDFREYKNQVQKMQSNSIPRIVLTIRLMFILFLAAPIVQLIWVENMCNAITQRTAFILLSGTRSEESVFFPFLVEQMRKLIETNSSSSLGFDTYMKYYLPADAIIGNYLPYGPNNDLIPQEYVYLQNQSMSLMATAKSIQFTLYENLDRNGPLFYRWENPSLNLSISTGVGTERWNTSLNFFDASTQFWSVGTIVAEYPDPVYKYVTSYNTSDYVDYDYDWRFVMDTFPFSYADTFDSATKDYTTVNVSDIDSVLIISWVILGISCFVVATVGLTFLRPSVDRIFREYELATAALLAIPRDVIENHYGRIKDILGIKVKGNKEKALTERDSEHISQNISDKEDEDDYEDEEDELGEFDTSDSTSNSMRAQYRKVTLIYALSLVGIVVLFVIMALVIDLSSSNLVDKGSIARESIRIRLFTRRMGYLVEMMTVDDTVTYPDIDYLAQMMQENLSNFTQIESALMFGDPSLGIPYGRMSTSQIPNLLVQKYQFDQLESVDEAKDVLIQEVETILRKSLPLQVSDTSRAKILERIPCIIDGYTAFGATIDEEISLALWNLIVTIRAIFATIVVSLFLIYFIVFGRLISYLQMEHEKALLITLQLPPHAAKMNYPLQVLLRGKIAAKEMFEEQKITGIAFDQDGYPLPQASVSNLAYVRTVISASSRNLNKRVGYFFAGLFGYSKLDGSKDDDTSNGLAKAQKVSKKNEKEDKKKVKAAPAVLKTTEIIEPEENDDVADTGREIDVLPKEKKASFVDKLFFSVRDRFSRSSSCKLVAKVPSDMAQMNSVEPAQSEAEMLEPENVKGSEKETDSKETEEINLSEEMESPENSTSSK